MRVVFGVLSLLVVVAIVGILAKKQLGAMSGPPAGSAASAPAGTVVAPTGTPQQQVQQVQKQVQDAMQQARPMPDETK
ncbi:periplasmic heavy metal sensor [Caenimonas sp. SL110]|uniref:periplasmic heavy metal sensor n=1 Tax=Caenimonas sp. SL110 TaxID=1450524 RepID=UPI000652C112|nr:periplasmic heavy metal sensor [Caenimonas sp. SL110]